MADAVRRAPAALGMYPLALGDFDGDGYADVGATLGASATSTDNVTRVSWGGRTRMTGDRAWSAEPVLFAETFAFQRHADLDGDGADDYLSFVDAAPIPTTSTRFTMHVRYGGGRPAAGAKVADLPGADLVAKYDLRRAVVGRVPTVNAATAIALATTGDPGRVYVVPAGAQRLSGTVELDNGVSYVGHPREYCVDTACTQHKTTAQLGQPVLADLGGDGQPDLLVPELGSHGLSTLGYVISSAPVR